MFRRGIRVPRTRAAELADHVARLQPVVVQQPVRLQAVASSLVMTPTPFVRP